MATPDEKFKEFQDKTIPLFNEIQAAFNGAGTEFYKIREKSRSELSPTELKDAAEFAERLAAYAREMAYALGTSVKEMKMHAGKIDEKSENIKNFELLNSFDKK